MNTCFVTTKTKHVYEETTSTVFIHTFSCGHQYNDRYGDEPNYCPVCGSQVTKHFHTEERRGAYVCGKREDDWSEGNE